ncbi:MAG: LuxR C-terminal-related transcriptional regulator [Alphaproteobacteria bacterium]|nr:LuxR C-terminal-related transcriptional regulator [Alphaproteobacteria bacterium]
MSELGRHLDDSAYVFGMQTAVGTGVADVLDSARFDPHYLDIFQADFGTLERNPLNAAHMASPIGRPFAYESYVDRVDLEKSDVFGEVFQPAKLVHWLPMTLARADRWFAVVNFQRSPRQKGFESVHWRFLEVVGPHLQRATRVFLEFSKLQGTQAAYEEAFSALGHGIVLLGRDGRIAFANDAAERMIKAGDGLTSRQGRLVAALPSERARFARGIAEATGMAGSMAAAAGFRLSRPGGGALICLLFPIGDGQRSSFAERPSTMLLCRPDDAGVSEQTETLIGLYGFSPRQAELVSLLLAGNSLPMIAQHLGISQETARTHLRRVFAKTGVTSQIELVRMIASGPPGLSRSSVE